MRAVQGESHSPSLSPRDNVSCRRIDHQFRGHSEIMKKSIRICSFFIRKKFLYSLNIDDLSTKGLSRQSIFKSMYS
jgi:hypothetical protein